MESHSPSRNAVSVPRNTAIIVTFKQPIKLSSIIRDYNDNGTPENLSDDTGTEGINDDGVKIFRTDAGPGEALASDRVRVRFTEDRRTFIFRPVELLGSGNVNVGYGVSLEGGRTGVLLENGDVAFGGAFSTGYVWNFEVGTVTDLTPPRVVAVTPRPGNQYARNIVIQVTFNEAVDPTSATGFVTGGEGFQSLQVHAGGFTTPPQDGEYRISNRYRTVEFIPATFCGRNACGTDMYCLPGATGIDAIVKAATVEGSGPAAQFLASGFDGVVDVAGNSLDGNNDGLTQGPGADDYSWAFGTSEEVSILPPSIEETVPPADPLNPGQSNIDPFAPVTARFDTTLRGSTVNTDHAYILAQEPVELADTFWWHASLEDLTAENTPVASREDVAVKSQIMIEHRTYATSTEYDPFLLSGIQDTYQNCFNPVSGPGCAAGPGGPTCCQGTRQTAECTF